VAREVLYTPKMYPKNFITSAWITNIYNKIVTVTNSKGEEVKVWRKGRLRTCEWGCGARQRYFFRTAFKIRGKYYEAVNGLYYFELLEGTDPPEYKSRPLSKVNLDDIEAVLLFVRHGVASRVKSAWIKPIHETPYGYVSAGSSCAIDSDVAIFGFWPLRRTIAFMINKPEYRGPNEEIKYIIYRWKPDVPRLVEEEDWDYIDEEELLEDAEEED